jgi:hypothetical protein
VDWKLFIQLLVTAAVAVVGAWLAHRLSARRDFLNERRKLRIQYLLEAYRRLEAASNRPLNAETMKQFESATADIQLLGSPEQVRMARQFALQMAADGTSSLDALISDLRNTLRNELALEPVSDSVVYIRLVTD